LTLLLSTSVPAAPTASRHRLRPEVRTGNVIVDRSTLFAGHAECPGCHAFVRQLSSLGSASIVRELVAGYCDVCCTTTYFMCA